MVKKHKIPATVVIVAAGASSRMGEGLRKQYRPLGGGTVLSESIKPFLKALDCRMLVIAIPSDEDESHAREALASDAEVDEMLDTKPIFVCGGATRQSSVKIALEAARSRNLAFRTILLIFKTCHSNGERNGWKISSFIKLEIKPNSMNGKF